MYRIGKNTSKSRYLGSILLLVCVSTAVRAELNLQTGIDAQAHLPFWEISDAGMSLRLVQRLPIQTRGFFLARGFNQSQVERIAQSCVFQTVFKNISDQTTTPASLTVNLRDWRVNPAGKSQGLKTREDWQKQWQAEKVNKQQQLAFAWALYPTEQEYKPGDYNWGMTIYNLPPATRFDLQVVWQQFGKVHNALIKGLECAADTNPQSTE